MSDTGIFWIRDDFRVENNPALSFATQNHDNVIALFIYNNNLVFLSYSIINIFTTY